MSEQTENSSVYPLIGEDTADVIKDMLQEMKLCTAADTITSITKAGEGNMNVVLRVRIADKSLIVKQSCPWVAKYPSIEAPEERIVAELDFYRRVQDAVEVTAALPKLLGFDINRRTIVMEDLGAASDYLSLYASETTEPEPTSCLPKRSTGWLVYIKFQSISRPTSAATN